LEIFGNFWSLTEIVISELHVILEDVKKDI
jgi:hypothetical protein